MSRKRLKLKLPAYPISREQFDKVLHEFLCSEGARAVEGIEHEASFNWHYNKKELMLNSNIFTPFYGDHIHHDIPLRKAFDGIWQMGLYEDDFRKVIAQLRTETDRLERKLNQALAEEREAGAAKDQGELK